MLYYAACVSASPRATYLCALVYFTVTHPGILLLLLWCSSVAKCGLLVTRPATRPTTKGEVKAQWTQLKSQEARATSGATGHGLFSGKLAATSGSRQKPSSAVATAAVVGFPLRIENTSAALALCLSGDL